MLGSEKLQTLAAPPGRWHWCYVTGHFWCSQIKTNCCLSVRRIIITPSPATPWCIPALHEIHMSSNMSSRENILSTWGDCPVLSSFVSMAVPCGHQCRSKWATIISMICTSNWSSAMLDLKYMVQVAYVARLMIVQKAVCSWHAKLRSCTVQAASMYNLQRKHWRMHWQYTDT